MRRIPVLFIALSLLSSCERVPAPPEPELVVDGWIEDGGFPVVLVSRTLPVSTEETGVDEVKKCVVSQAKVSVSDGERTAVLTGGIDSRYFPPFKYTTGMLRGVAGKEYTLKVEYRGRTVTATTSIPEPVPLDTVYMAPLPEEKTLYTVRAVFRNDPSTPAAYIFFVMEEGKDLVFNPSRIGAVTCSSLDSGQVELPVSPASGLNRHYSPYFSGSNVRVRFCTMDLKSYEYWTDFQDIVSFSSNPVIPANHSVRSNVAGGKGLWAGYGSVYYSLNLN